ncbi:hypothetical protein C8R45DRAFT_1005805 [Mycena sanguinolenta]|nr:hypothetical protein C8R45DRAFT_1005805 [Mycena sanguinolenta]
MMYQQPRLIYQNAVYACAEKVAGSRRKGKGKERADPKGKKRQRASSGSDNDSEPVAKRGRPQGSANYSKDNLSKMFDIIEDVLPIGQKGWKEVERRYNRSAKQRGWAERPPKVLENKFKQYLRQKKPTGSAACPPEVKRAHEIEELINQRVGTRELSDSEFDDPSDPASSDDDLEVVERTAIARRAPTPPLPRKSRSKGADLANKIASAFDPEAQKNRDDARAHRSFENTQLLAMSQQLRDAQATAENLRSENNVLRNRIHDLERKLERSELRQEMMSYAGRRQADSPSRSWRGRTPSRSRRGRSTSRSRRRSRSPPRYRVPGYRSHKRDAGIDRVNGKIRCETVFPEGGAATYFISDPSTDEYYNNNDEEENRNPFRLDRPWDHLESPRRSPSRVVRPPSRRRTPSAGPSRRPMSHRRTPTPGPSRLPALLPSPSLPLASGLAGNAVELIVTPRHGPAVAFIVSPTKPSTVSDRN